MNHYFKNNSFHSSTSSSLQVCLLHGNLDIYIKQANNLPNMDMFHKKIGDMLGSLPFGSRTMSKITSDPFVTISVSQSIIGQTYVIDNSENPVWDQHFNVPIAHRDTEVLFIVKDDDFVGYQIIGAVGIPTEQILSGSRIEGVYPILNSSGKQCKPGASLSLSIQYIPIERFYEGGVGAASGVPDTYFPLRPGGKVTLYQDAHVHEPSLPKQRLDDGIDYIHGQCWNDIYDSISQAKWLVYLTGWSVCHDVKLVREDNENTGRNLTLGDLLKKKSEEGVRVLLLVWDDPTSLSLLGMKKEGIMKTNDEETRRFFKHSSVRILLCPRSSGKGHSWMKKREAETIYTHHQKTVIVDADAGSNKRKIIAFIGGLDLCSGRYDTPDHPLLRTMKTVHKDDFHNPNFAGPSEGCPREPWHDLHSKIDGPAAYDILTNFQERWLRTSNIHRLSKLKRHGEDSLLKIESISEIIGMNDLPCLKEDDPLGWNVQIFRSIDSNSVKGFPKDPKDATMKNLACGKNVVIDMSIHSAYVKAIRSAKHFIYIENQYFLGSSYNWEKYKNLGINNLIPMEIALKIANKIRGNQRFAVYIVIPMYPEGGSTANATQRILYWQNKTMQMMYDVIYKALQEVGLDNQYEPQDYLNFFCLGNRETQEIGQASDIGKNVPKNSPQFLAQKNQRFMIYVHSKGMIIDDEYVILGSANINQRSLEGSRDTEIAMGAYQPQFTWERKGSKPFGQIYGYRMSLWAEHTGVVEDCFMQPENIECVRRMRAMGEHNWRLYAGEELTEMTSHLLKYPVQVDRNGKVKSIPGCETFPDVGGNILGNYFVPIKENLTP